MENESKVLYRESSDQPPRAIRGRVRIEDAWVVVERDTGTFRIPVGNVVWVEEARP